jgi:hypothetical protein
VLSNYIYDVTADVLQALYDILPCIRLVGSLREADDARLSDSGSPGNGEAMTSRPGGHRRSGKFVTITPSATQQYSTSVCVCVCVCV